MLVADRMTATGEIQAVGRQGISGSKGSVLARAAFEETKKHLIAASIRKEYDDLTGIVENIMMNQVIPLGTGAYDLSGEVPKEPAVKAAVPAEEEKPAAKKAAPKAETKKKASEPKKAAKKPAKAEEKAAKKAAGKKPAKKKT